MSIIPIASHFHHPVRRSYNSTIVENLRRTLTLRLLLGVKAAEENCSLDGLLEDVRAVAPEQFRKLFDSVNSRPGLNVRMSNAVLKRAFGLLFDGLISAGSKCEIAQESAHLVTRICMNGFGVLIEINDNRFTLAQRLLNTLAQIDSTSPAELPGRQLFKARDILEQHGGRMRFWKLEDGKGGVKVHIYLPLSPATSTSRSN